MYFPLRPPLVSKHYVIGVNALSYYSVDIFQDGEMKTQSNLVRAVCRLGADGESLKRDRECRIYSVSYCRETIINAMELLVYTYVLYFYVLYLYMNALPGIVQKLRN